MLEECITEESTSKPLRGFATMSPEKRKQIASMGGKAAQSRNKGRRWTPEQARYFGRLGGLAGKGKRKAHGKEKDNK